MSDTDGDMDTLQLRANVADQPSENDQSLAQIKNRGNVEISSDVHAELAEGVTYSGIKFLVPKTADTIEVFLSPEHMNFATLIALIPITINALLAFYFKVPISVSIVWFLFFRACYNVGLGYLLYIQSNYDQITKFYRKYKTDQTSGIGYIVNKLVNGGMPKGYEQKDFPDEFNAWILYKAVVNVSLVNDSTAYSFLALRCYTFPESITLGLILQYVIAAGLFIFNWWAKVDAHRCIGTYCWYWGDFFYRKNVELTFDGIFELFPHPMYTVGYSVYYAVVLITQSYTMLLVSLIAHLSQICFLIFVEEPHIKKIYPEPENDKTDDKKLYDAQSGWFPAREDIIYFVNIDLYSSGTWLTLITSLYCVITALLPESTFYPVAQVLFWRFIHWFVLGFILWQQSKRGMWTQHFLKQGRTTQEAFGHWRRIYNMSSAANLFAFLACSIRFLPVFTLETIFSMEIIAKIFVCIALCLLSFWTVYSTYHSIGNFGWFYGDFFVPPSEYTPTLCYTGIYRFLNNPDTLTGYAGLYGIAILCEGWTMLVLAMLSHGLNMLFLHAVEIPHMQNLYDNTGSGVRSKGPLRSKVMSLIQSTSPVQLDQLNVSDEIRRVKVQTLTKVYDIYRKLASQRSDEQKPTSKCGTKVIITCPKTSKLGVGSIDVQVKTEEDHQETDWIGLYQVDIPSGPGLSDGCWMYVPPGSQSTLRFKSFMLPRFEGVYEFRYHRANSYDIIASCPIVFTNSDDVNCQLNSLASPKKD